MNQKYKKHLFAKTLLLLALCIGASPVSALFDSGTGIDLAETGNGIFSAAYQNNSIKHQQFLEEGFTDFHKKLSYVLYKDGRLSHIFEICPDCKEELIQESYNELIVSYILDNYDLFTEQYDKRAFELDLSTLALAGHLHPDALGIMTSRDNTIVHQTATSLAVSIIEQIREQADAFEAIGTGGLNYDGAAGDGSGEAGEGGGDTAVASLGASAPFLLFRSGSSSGGGGQPKYDVMKAIYDINAQFLCNPHAQEGYKNTIFDKGSKLLTGGGGSIGYSGGSFGAESTSGEQGEGFNTTTAVNVEFQSNSSRVKGAFFSQYCEGKDTYETMFRELLDWVVRELDKKNLDCKRENTKHFFEPNFSLSGLGKFFKDIFTGVSINVTTKRPPSLQGKNYDAQEKERQTAEQKAQERKGFLDGVFQTVGLASFPGNNSFLIRKGDEYAHLNRGTAGNQSDLTQPVRDVQGALDAQQNNEPSYKTLANQSEREQTRHVNSAIIELAQLVRTIFRAEKDMEAKLDYLEEKPDCE